MLRGAACFIFCDKDILSLLQCISYSCGRDYCNDKEIMGIADAMAENGMRALGYQYINMDGLCRFECSAATSL